jgi:SAM-dependent methyltransferase
MARVGGHLAVMQPTRFRALYARAFGTSELALRVRTRHLLREIRGIGPRTLLDVGCGAGFLSIQVALANPEMQVVGVDRNADQVEYAREIVRRLGIANVSFLLLDVSAVEACFDCVVCADVIHGAGDWQSLLMQAAERVNPGGTLVIHSPAPRGRFKRPFTDLNLGLESGDVVAKLKEFQLLTFRRTMRVLPELAFETMHPEYGVLRSRSVRLFAMPLLALATRMDTGLGGAAWLASLGREESSDRGSCSVSSWASRW